ARNAGRKTIGASKVRLDAPFSSVFVKSSLRYFFFLAFFLAGFFAAFFAFFLATVRPPNFVFPAVPRSLPCSGRQILRAAAATGPNQLVWLSNHVMNHQTFCKYSFRNFFIRAKSFFHARSSRRAP